MRHINGLNLTVHPFGDEWTWDATTGGRSPMVFDDVASATFHAQIVKSEYVALDVDEDWPTTFWSAIYDNEPNPRTEDGYDQDGSSMLYGYVTPAGKFVQCHDESLIPLDSQGGYAA